MPSRRRVKRYVKKSGLSGFFHGFYFAWNGIRSSFDGHRNMLIHAAVAVAVVAAGILLRVPRLDMIILICLCFLVLILETVNSAVEELINELSPGHNEAYGKVKDMMAGAVLLAAVMSVIAGAMIFLRPFTAMFGV